MSGHVLELQNLTMQFGGVVAVDDLSMYVDKGGDHRAHRTERRG